MKINFAAYVIYLLGALSLFVCSFIPCSKPRVLYIKFTNNISIATPDSHINFYVNDSLISEYHHIGGAETCKSGEIRISLEKEYSFFTTISLKYKGIQYQSIVYLPQDKEQVYLWLNNEIFPEFVRISCYVEPKEDQYRKTYNGCDDTD